MNPRSPESMSEKTTTQEEKRYMTRSLRFVVTFAVFLLLAPIALLAHPGHDEPGAAVTMTGEVIDPVCYLSHEHATGASHAACATACAKKGNALGVLEAKTGTIYLSLPVNHGDPNVKLLPFVGQQVEVQGKKYQKGGLTGIFVESVKPVARQVGFQPPFPGSRSGG
ncbi:MAG TPA: hypothetical protein VIC33_14470 [Vicinamibacterales bacterium]|jgi:hypothetical protein